MDDIALLVAAIQTAPFLSEEERDIILDTLKDGEPYPEELFEVLSEFIVTMFAYQDYEEEMLTEKAIQLRAEIDDLTQKTKENPEEIRNRVKRMITVTNKFLEQLKVEEKGFQEEIEGIIHDKKEGAQVNALHEFLKQPKSDS